MYLPHYSYTFNESEKTIQQTQKNAFSSPMAALMNPLSFIVTMFAIICDFYQVKYFLDLYTKAESKPLIPVAILIVMALDFSMYLLGKEVNSLRASTKTKKKDVIAKAAFLVLAFILAYIIYFLLAYSVISDAVTDTEKPQYFRLFLPAMTSVLCFAISLNFSNASTIAKLKSEALSIETDIASARALSDQISRDLKLFDQRKLEQARFKVALHELAAKMALTEHDARCALDIYTQSSKGSAQSLDALGLTEDFLQSTLKTAEQAGSFFALEPDKESDTLSSL